MVEIQLGSIDMTQSMAANEMVKPYRISPGPLTALKRALLSRAPGRSCSTDHRVSRNDSKFQMAKYRMARMMKPWTER